MTKDLNSQKMQLLAALVCDPHVQAAADVSRTTAYRWLHD